MLIVSWIILTETLVHTAYALNLMLEGMLHHAQTEQIADIRIVDVHLPPRLRRSDNYAPTRASIIASAPAKRAKHTQPLRYNQHLYRVVFTKCPALR